jgi:putative ABC transport system permease protein
MSRRLSAQTRKSIADIVRRKAPSLLIVLAILIPVGGLTAANVADDSLSSAYAFSVGTGSAQPDATIVVDKTTPAMLAAISHAANVGSVQHATTLSTQWNVAEAPGHVDFTVVSYPDLRHVPLTPFQLISGRYPGAGEIVMEFGDSGLQHVGLGDMVTVGTARGGRRLRVVGIARTPGLNPAVSGKGLGYMSEAGLAALPAFTYVPGPAVRQPLRTEEIAVGLHAPAAYQGTVSALTPIITAHGGSILAVIPPENGVPVAQLRGILSLVRVLILVAFLLAAILVLHAVTALVTEQTAVIGTMKAIGGTRARIVRGYVTTVLLCSAVATPIGVALGVFIGANVASGLARSIPLAPGPFVLSPAVIGLGLGVGFGVPVLAALVPLWLGTKVSVREALEGFGVVSAGVTGPGHLARLAAGRLGWVPQSVWLALRGLFRRPWRAALSIFTVAVAAACFLVVGSLATSVNGSIASVWADFHADVEVYAGGQDYSYQEVTSVFASVPDIGRIERVGWYGAQTPWGKVAAWGVEPGSRIYSRHVTSGRWFTTRDSGVLLVSDDLARRSGLHTGSTVSLPGPGGSLTMTFTVIGTIHESVDDLSQAGAIVMPVNELYELEGASPSHIGDFTNRLMVQARDRSPAAVDRLTRGIDRAGRDAAAGKQGAIAEVFAFHDEVVRQQRNFLPVYALLVAVALVVAAVGILGLTDALGASVVERRRDIGLLRSLGASGRRIAVVFWIEGLALSAGAWILASAAGFPLAHLFVHRFSTTVMPTDFYFAPLTLAVSVGGTLVIATLATALPARRAARMRAVDLLRGE